MKKLYFWALPIALTLVLATSCKKKNDSQKDILRKKISDIIPQRYLDTLNKMGLQVNEGENPPDIQGIFEIAPARLRATNVPNDAAIGHTFDPVKIKLYEQGSSDFSVRFVSKKLVGHQDTSLATVVAGRDNKFTVYAKARGTSGVNYADFGIIITGTREGSVLKNVVYGLICIDDSHGGNSFIKQGQGRMFRDDDFISTATTVFRLQQAEGKLTGGTAK